MQILIQLFLLELGSTSMPQKIIHAWTFPDAGARKRVCNQSKSSHAQRRIDRFVCELDIKGLVTKLITGLAAMAIGLGKETSNHTAELITPILTCLTGLSPILICLTGLLMRWTTVANMMLYWAQIIF